MRGQSDKHFDYFFGEYRAGMIDCTYLNSNMHAKVSQSKEKKKKNKLEWILTHPHLRNTSGLDDKITLLPATLARRISVSVVQTAYDSVYKINSDSTNPLCR